MTTLAVIPARGGSKAIPRKNVRLIGNRPLIAHTIGVALAAEGIDAVVVTSDDQQILDIAADHRGVHLRHRPEALGRDDVTLDPVVHDAVVSFERETGKAVDIVVTMQPTSPLLHPGTLDAALAAFRGSERDSTIAVVEDVHLRWRETPTGPEPLYEKRVNRQWLPREFRETGAFVISRRAVVSAEGRLGRNIAVHPVPRDQAIDIDSPLDWFVAEALLSRRHIVALVNGNAKVGLGHVYNMLTLADQFIGHHVELVTWDSDPAVVEMMRGRRHPVVTVPDLEAALAYVEDTPPDIVVNDILDTDVGLVERQRAAGALVVNFEDLGSGSLRAHLVINALYEMSDPPATHLSGARYVCLDQNFMIERPVAFRTPAHTLLVTFGGGDERNMTLRVARLLPRLFAETPLERALIVVGPGYAHAEGLEAFLADLDPDTRERITVHRSVANMARLMRQADLAVTSNGRTVYEVASMFLPALVISQNDRETSHLWSRYTRGVDYLGMGAAVEDATLFAHIVRVATEDDLRHTMREALEAVDIRGGARRVRDTILDSYWKWRHGSDYTR